MRLVAFGLVGLACLLGLAELAAQKEDPKLVAPTEPLTPEQEQKHFKLPPGFVMELVAAEPDIHKPMNLNFDDRGRLWVTDTLEYPYPATGDRKPRDTVKIIEFADGKARAAKITTFADGLNIPIGVMPLPAPSPQAGEGRVRGTSALVFSIPNLFRFTDTQGTGRADQREVAYGTYGFKDTHGMTSSLNWGFDGWLYVTHGFANNSTVKAADGSTIQMHSGNTYRIRPDGSRVEQFTWGQVNPFGLCFDPLGNLYSADCHTKPATLLLRGGYYDSFGKPHDGLGYAPNLMTHDHGSTAICGITHYAATQFPPEYRDTLFIGNVVTNRINHDKLERHGSTYRAILQPDFLSSTDPWFRPVDIKLGPDGCLYVADFYNRIIGHYEVRLDHPGRDRERGRIWRISYRGENSPPLQSPPDFTKLNEQELVTKLGDPNLTVRTFAANRLVLSAYDKVHAALNEVAAKGATAFQRLHARWVLERRGELSEELLHAGCGDADALVRVHALRVLSERKDWTPKQWEAVHASLRDSDAFVQRAATDAVGQHPDPKNVRPLLDLRARVPATDTLLLHTARMALRNQFRAADSWAKLPESWSESDGRALADVSPGIHTPEAGAFLIRHLQRAKEAPTDVVRYVRHAARYAPLADQPRLLTVVRGLDAKNLRQQANLLRAVQQGTQERGAGLSNEAVGWATDLVDQLLAAKENDLLQLGLDLTGALKLQKSQGAVVGVVQRKDAAEAPRRAAMTALVALDPKAHIGVLAGVVTDASDAIPLREHAATVLAGVNQPESRAELVKALPTAPARLQTVIAAGLAGTPQGAEQLLDAVAAGKASARLLQERAVETRLQQAKVPNIKERIAKLTVGLPPADQRFQELLQKRRSGYAAAKPDAALGAKIFEKHCAACHQIANMGAKVGPQLDGVGLRGLDRLLEDVVDPNRNVDQAFRASTLAMKNGQIVTGLVLREEGEVVIVADAMGKEVRVEKKAIEERLVSQMSPMPANLVDQIPEPDFYHLLAYLLNQRTALPK
ncbi:MAG: c-type cytochrome [Planctomycetia bacterium]|nr:c-type cytochrome [Planctomycetia bacterium]